MGRDHQRGPPTPCPFPVGSSPPSTARPHMTPLGAQSSPTFLGKGTHLVWSCIFWGRGLHRLMGKHVKDVTGCMLLSSLHPGRGLLATATRASHAGDL